ncbi:MAG: hypothetical protein JWN44_2159 [Myxococcales bacterium]|nr:hypothetical protein [Myxococcales bacterium]
MTNAAHWDVMTSPDGCGPDQYWSFAMSMCSWRPSARGHVSGMVMGALFLADVGVSGRRSAHDLAAPHWLMLDVGVDLARWNRLELDVMLTAERWTIPDSGYPLPFQVGEENEHQVPFVDAQHPHSSPIMGLALADVVSLSTTTTRLLRVWFAPRGESTDGPIAFMHRATGTINPDAPLGHHIGQDVGHISSTVIGLSLTLPTTTIELSTFHGREPQPDAVDLPLGTPDSAGARVAQQLGRHYTVAASLAYVRDPEAHAVAGAPQDPVVRASASAYARWDLPLGWRAHATLIWGGISNYDSAPWLDSITGEVLFTDWSNRLWGRIEAVQRTPAELRVPNVAPARANDPDWVGAATLGYTRKIVALGPADFWIGGSGTLNFLTDTFLPAYGGNPILSGKLFVEARMMQMFDWRP